MKKFLLYVWQLPQNLVGLIVINVLTAQKRDAGYWVHFNPTLSSVSLGNYIILSYRQALRKNVLEHEQGHQRQSKYLGPLYLILIGLPSVVGNILHRSIKFDYYKQPWELWADKLGGVQR